MSKKYLFLLLILGSCATPQKLSVTDSANSSLIVGGKIFTAAFQQKAGEYRALCIQAYNIARLRLDQALSDTTSIRPKAIVTDIDETVLDNSPYAVHQGLKGKDYDSESWAVWTSMADADTLSGALGFFKYAASKNVEVFYVTNRAEKERRSTLENLKKFGFPYADDTHLILKTAESSKEPRRQQLAKNYDIVLLIGDNLSDFSTLFDRKTTEQRNQNVQLSAAEFGKRFIVLPGANYGDWESALYHYNHKLTLQQRDSVFRSELKSY